MAKQNNKQQIQKSNMPTGNAQDAEFAQGFGQNNDPNAPQNQNNKQQNNKNKR